MLLLVTMLLLACRPLNPYLAPNMVVKEASYPEHVQLPKPPITAARALRNAIRSLEQRGVASVRLCQIDWMVAGVGAALIYATGRWDLEGVHFEQFFVAIYDGTEHGHEGGDEYLMIARGFDRAGHETYYDGGAGGPGLKRYSDFDTDDELKFASLSRQTLEELPKTCGLRKSP